MSAPYNAADVREILATFVGEFIVDVPSHGVSDGHLVFREDEIARAVVLADDEWYEEIARFANSNAA